MYSQDTYVSEAYMSASIMRPVVAISTPIFENQQIVGIMIGAVELSALNEVVRELSYGETGISYIIDKNGNVVAHPNIGSYSTDSLVDFTSSNIVQKVLNEKDSITTTEVVDDNSGESAYVYFKQLGDTEWYIISQQSKDEATAHIKASAKVSIYVMAIIVVISSVLHFLNAKHIVSTLEKLTSIAKAFIVRNIEELDYSSIKNVKIGTNEVVILCDSFVTMLDNLYDYHTEMESRILDRTLAVNKSNEELEKSLRHIEAQRLELLFINDQLNTSIRESQDMQEELVETRKRLH